MKKKHIIIMLLTAVSLSSCGIYLGPRRGYYARPHYYDGHYGCYYHIGHYHYSGCIRG